MPTPTAVVAALAAYDPGHDLMALRAKFRADDLVELGSNENAFGPCAAASEIVRRSGEMDLLRYPDPHCHALKAALAIHHRVAQSDIIVANGSHELLMQLAQAYAGPGDEVLYSQFGFAVYAIAAASVGAIGVVAAAKSADDAQAPRGHDLDAFAAALTQRTRLIYLANPNNPTGTAFPITSFASFLEAVPRNVLVVVDEAYVEYASEPARASVLSIRDRHANLVMTRTFSKIHGLAGLRVGYAIAHPEIVKTLDRLRETFNVNALAQTAATAALADTLHTEACRRRNRELRQALIAALRGLGLRVPDSHGNFVLIDFEGTGQSAASIEQGLLARGVVVRPMRGYGLPECLRITVGIEKDQSRFLDALRGVIA
ncbi:MAG: histidinol-phosphate transaminase [Lysobacterales bacterium]